MKKLFFAAYFLTYDFQNIQFFAETQMFLYRITVDMIESNPLYNKIYK